MISVANKHKKKDAEEDLPRQPAYYWWFLANTLALCFAIVSWALCLNIFGNPEVPRNYQILKKLGRLPELRRYTVLDVPNGNSLSASELYGKYFGLEGQKRDRLNALLMRNYMHNFGKNLLLTYVEGEFLYPGFAIRAQAMVRADDFTESVGFPVVIEYIFPTEDVDAANRFSAADVMEVNKNPNCAAVVHVSRTIADDEPALLLTVIPIAYGPYRVGNAKSFSIEPPKELNPANGLPVWK